MCRFSAGRCAIIGHALNVSNEAAAENLADSILDWTCDNVNAKRRDANMRRAHAKGAKACECCGLALKPGHLTIGTVHIGPECAKRLRADGIIA